VTVTLHSWIRERQPAGAKSVDGLQVAELTATAPTYDEAKALLERQVPEGWILLGIGRLEV
jgi:hypothetical protein